PLMVVLAAGAALVLLAVLSGIVTSALVGPGPATAWQAPPGSGSPPTSAPAGPGDAETITFSGGGDVIMGRAPGDLPPSGGTGLFDRVQEALAADLVMGNLETPLTEDTGRTKCPTPPATGCHQFRLPPSYANHLRAAGFHLMNLANNHTNDM